MFAGHMGAGLLLKAASRETGLGWLFLGVMFLDVLLWLFVLLGLESVHAPENFRKMADLRYDFPFSHGLTATLLWATSGFAAGWFLIGKNSPRRLAIAITLAAAIFSHFVLDCLVHVPELPVLGRGSQLLGLSLWNNLPLSWAFEAAIAVSGLLVYLKVKPLSRRRTLTLIFVMLFVTIATVLGQNSNSMPPSMAAMAGTSIITIAILIAFGWWLERQPSLFKSHPTSDPS